MNLFAIIILTALIGEFIIELTADLLNLGMLTDRIPDEFKGVYDEKSYKNSQEYLKANTGFGWISSLFSLVVILLFWFFKGFPLLDRFIVSLEFGPVFSGVIFMGILIAANSIISLPFSLYKTFVIEERFGFNKTTIKTYITDMIKSAFLGILIGCPVLAGILAFFQYAGEPAWLYCWVTVVLFMLLLQYLIPVWIMPLFNKFEPLEDGELKEAVFDYARSIDFSLTNIFKMDGSKRSSKSNAFFTGFGKNKRIVLFDTLINQHTTGELLAVLAHEMGHYKKKHIIKTMIAGIVQAGILFYILSLCLSGKGLFEAFYMETMPVYAGLIFFSLLFTPISFFTGILMQIYSRKNEFEADTFAAETTGRPEDLISALKKLYVSNLGNLMPHPFYVFLNYSHPPVLQRINSLRKPGPQITDRAKQQ